MKDSWVPKHSNGIAKPALHLSCLIIGIASEAQCSFSDRAVVAQESVTSQSGDRTGVQITAGFVTHIHTATGASETISFHFGIITVAKQVSFFQSKS